MFTRLKDDPYEIKKELQQSTDQGLYYLNTPGIGMKTPFIADPQIRLQYWGANLRTNSIDIENSLRGLTTPLSSLDCNKSTIPKSVLQKYKINEEEITHQSRTIMPAWKLRCQETKRWDYAIPDPKKKLFIPFQEYTRIQEKDQFNKH
jgi:hypothetical protein